MTTGFEDHEPIPDTLSDGRIRLTRYRMEHVEQLFAAASSSQKELQPWMPWCHPDYKIEESHAWVRMQIEKWDARREFEFAIESVSDGAYLGGCGLNSLSTVNRLANLGYWVRSSTTGQGVAGAATRVVARFGLQSLGLHRIEIFMAVGNIASARVAAKAGAQKEGILRHRLLLHGQLHDAVMYSLVNVNEINQDY